MQHIVNSGTDQNFDFSQGQEGQPVPFQHHLVNQDQAQVQYGLLQNPNSAQVQIIYPNSLQWENIMDSPQVSQSYTNSPQISHDFSPQHTSNYPIASQIVPSSQNVVQAVENSPVHHSSLPDQLFSSNTFDESFPEFELDDLLKGCDVLLQDVARDDLLQDDAPEVLLQDIARDDLLQDDARDDLLQDVARNDILQEVVDSDTLKNENSDPMWSQSQASASTQITTTAQEYFLPINSVDYMSVSPPSSSEASQSSDQEMGYPQIASMDVRPLPVVQIEQQAAPARMWRRLDSVARPEGPTIIRSDMEYIPRQGGNIVRYPIRRATTDSIKAKCQSGQRLTLYPDLEPQGPDFSGWEPQGQGLSGWKPEVRTRHVAFNDESDSTGQLLAEGEDQMQPNGDSNLERMKQTYGLNGIVDFDGRRADISTDGARVESIPCRPRFRSLKQSGPAPVRTSDRGILQLDLTRDEPLTSVWKKLFYFVCLAVPVAAVLFQRFYF